MNALANASIFALLGMFIGLVPLSMGIVYAIWPAEQRLALMRPLSLAAIFACVSSTVLGLVNVFVGMGKGQAGHIAAIGLAESLVPVFLGFGSLAVAWLCVAVGMWRRP
jgi:hypothetical protein